MSTEDTRFAWWSRLRHSGLLLSPVVQIEKYAEAPEEPKWYQPEKLRTSFNRFLASIDRSKDRPQLAQGDILTWVDALLEKYIGHEDQRLSRSHNIPESLTAVIRIGSRTETLRPDRVLFAEDGKMPLLLVKADTSPHIGRGKGRTEYSRFLELLRGSGHRLGLLTNGLQFRLVYAGLDFESWCEWESERWFEDTEGTEELLGLRQILFPTQITDNKGEVIGAGLPGLLTAIEESRKRQADLSQVLRENVRQAVEMLLEDVSNASRTDSDLFQELIQQPSSTSHRLTDAEAQEALLQATVRVVMRMVVCLFAESRGLLPVNDLIYSQAYGVRTLYELLDETVRHEGSQLGLMSRHSAWARLMAVFRLIHGGSSHGGFPLRAYSGSLLRPGAADADDPVLRALFILEHKVNVNDSTIFRVLRKLLRGPLPVLRGRSKTYVEGPVDYTELRTEFIGLIYEGLLDYRVKRTTEEIGPQVFLNLGRQPVLPLSVLERMLAEKPSDLKDLFDKLSKEKVTATVSSSDDESDDNESNGGSGEESEDDASNAEIMVETDESERVTKTGNSLDAVQAARRWAREAIVKTKRISTQTRKETNSEYDKRIEEAIDALIVRDSSGSDKVIAPGEFYLVRAGNTRKGTGTFYTRPQLAVPTVHRTLEPLCYDKDDKGVLTPKKPEQILALKVCDPACGSASFLVAALHYLTDALYKSLCFHCGLDDPKRAAKITLPFGKPATGKDTDATVPFSPDDPNRGEEFAERVQALLRRHVVERCIYGVDINPMAVEFARVSLWIETLDPELPFSFLDHKIKVGNSLVGCWLNRVQDYPIMAWSRLQRESDKKGELKEYSQAIKLTRDDKIKRLVREWISNNGPQSKFHFTEEKESVESVHRSIADAFEELHALPMSAVGIGQREAAYQTRVLSDKRRQRLKSAMDAWCSIWFWSPQQIDLCPLPNDIGTDLLHKPKTLAEVERVAAEHRFFHWELEFPDVFHEVGSGFDAMIGNPPWETSRPSSIEFFTEYDPVFRTYSNQDAKKRRKRICDENEVASRLWNNYLSIFASLKNWCSHVENPEGYHPRTADGPSSFNLLEKGAQWRKSDEYHEVWKGMRGSRFGFVKQDSQPFRLQGGADLNLYKLFLELAYSLLNPNGRLGFIVPSGLYTDAETLALREQFLEHSSWEWLFSFENKKKIFDIHGSFKFASTIVAKTSSNGKVPLKAAFMAHDLATWEQPQPPVFEFDTALIRLFSPTSRSIPEVTTGRDLEICRFLYERSLRFGDERGEWQIESSREYHMTDDSKHFPEKEKWSAKGYSATPYGDWADADGNIAVPFYEGRMVGQFDPLEKEHLSGKGRTADWQDIPTDAKHFVSQYLMDQDWYLSSHQRKLPPKIGYIKVTSATNSRTMIAAFIPDLPCGESVYTIRSVKRDTKRILALTAVLNSLTYDFALRARFGGINLSRFILSETPLPTLSEEQIVALATNALRLCGIHRRFAVDWLAARASTPLLGEIEWKKNWAVTAADRLRRRVECDAIVADGFQITPDDCDWIVRNDSTNPKGFWRVDKQLPYEERLTGLSARAFRALKEGKWSAESVGQLSNDEFFDLLGIPELTNAAAAHAKGLSSPLILKRDGCHSWQPENFSPDDPRHGWTWEDCRKDAITLLGSEEALEAYITQATGEESDDEEEEPDPNHAGPKDLFGNPIPTDLFGNEIRPKKKRGSK